MKKIILFTLGILIGFLGYAQMGTYSVSPNFGSAKASEYHQRTLDSGGVYLPNTAAHTYSVLKSYNINPVFMLVAAAQDSANVLAHIPTDGTGDGVSARNSSTYRVNQNSYLELVEANTLPVDYSNGIPYFATYPQRTNLVTYPISLDDVSWSLTNATLDDNTGAGYDTPLLSSGALTTDAFLLTSTAANGYIQLTTPITISNATAYANSIYIKRAVGTGNILIKDINNTETVVSGGIALADGWYKYDVVSTSSSTSGQIGVKLAATGDAVYVCYPQMEAGSYASPLILPAVEGSITTRLADAVTGFGSSATFSGVNSSGVLYAEIAANANEGSSRMISISDGTSGTEVSIYYTSTANRFTSEVRVGGTYYATLTHIVTDVTDFHKVAIRWAVNDFSLWIDGTEQATDVSGSVFSPSTLNTLDFGVAGVIPFFGKAKSVMVLNYLDDDDMQALTEMGMGFVSMFPLLLLAMSFVIRRKNVIEINEEDIKL